MRSAIVNGDISKLTTLLKETNQKNPIIHEDLRTLTPLTAHHYSAIQGRFDIFKNISDTLNNLQPKAISGLHKGITPLHYAAFEGHLDIVNYVTNCIQDINPVLILMNRTPLMLAAREGHLDIVRHLIEKGADPNIETIGQTAYDVAISKGHFKVARYLQKLTQNK